jgi:hypothetical protein
MPPAEDTRIWAGRVRPGCDTEHARFVAWLGSDEARSIFQRKRLTEYTLLEDAGALTVVFRAPHTGDPRILIDFLRYPGMWPDFWEFVSGGRGEDEAQPVAEDPRVKVHWRREDGA